MSFSARADRDETQPVIVKSLNSEKNLCLVEGRYSGEFQVKLGTSLASVVQYPAPGEQWLVQRVLGGWQLHSRLDFQDSRVLPDYPPGSTVFGSSGETHITGGSIHLDSEDVRVSGQTMSEYVSTHSTLKAQYAQFVPRTSVALDPTPILIPLKKDSGTLEFEESTTGTITIPKKGLWKASTRVYTIESGPTHRIEVDGVLVATARDSLYELLQLNLGAVLSLKAASPMGRSVRIDPELKGTLLTLEYVSTS